MYEDEFMFFTSELKSDFNIPTPVQQFDCYLLGKNKINNTPELGEFLTEKKNDDSALLLEDVMMLDDIQKFNMTNCISSNDQTLPSFVELHSSKTNFSFSPLPQNSSQVALPCISNTDEFLPNFLDTSNDTFQDLTPLMPQGTSQSVSSSSTFISDSYPTYTNVGENSSDSSFTMSSYTSEIMSINEQSSFSPRNFTNISVEENSFESTSKCSKYTKSLVIKHETRQDVRRKNNIASQRSRMTRKEKEREMEKRADILAKENETLRIKVKKMEEIAEELKRHLLQKILKR